MRLRNQVNIFPPRKLEKPSRGSKKRISLKVSTWLPPRVLLSEVLEEFA
jgi:hypothetical protein